MSSADDSFLTLIEKHHISNYYEFRDYIRRNSRYMTQQQFYDSRYHLSDDFELLKELKYEILWSDGHNNSFDYILQNPKQHQIELVENFYQLKELIQQKYKTIIKIDHKKLIQNAIKTGKFVPLRVKKSFNH